jgi:3-oxoacyl-[acyl-carrier protein] reductase
MNGTKELADRVALVTGAGRNIGRAIALALADAGAAVVVNARQDRAQVDAVVGEIEARGGRAFGVLADVADSNAITEMVKAIGARFGRIDFLVNNAALRREQPLEQITPALWREVLSVTLDGQFYCASGCLPYLKASGCGAIVNIGGLTAFTGAKGRAHVLAAKAGLIGLTRALATELADENITVNLVSPGLIGAPPPARPQHPRIATLTGAHGTPEDVAGIVRYLCGPQARYITGQTIHVNGGAFFGT